MKKNLFNDEAERAVLGCIFINPGAFAKAAVVLSAGDFYRKKNEIIYTGCCSLAERNEKIDYIMLSDLLRTEGKLEECGGMRYIFSLAEEVPSSANLMSYVKIVLDFAVLRRVQLAVLRVHDAIFEGKGLDTILETVGDVNTAVPVLYRDFADVGIDAVTKLSSTVKEGGIQGVRTGLRAIDSVLRGLRGGWLYVLGARPGDGKTALALQMGLGACLEHGHSVGVVSLEMTEEELYHRAAAILSSVSNEKIQDGNLDTDEFKRVKMTVDALKRHGGMYTYHNREASIHRVCAVIKQFVTQERIQVVFIDYLSYLIPDSENIPRWQVAGEVAERLKRLALELDIPIVLLSQINKVDAGKRPTLGHLRESGRIGEVADCVMLLHSQERPEGMQEVRNVDLIYSKNRHGSTGVRRLVFIPGQTKFEDPVPVSDKTGELPMLGATVC